MTSASLQAAAAVADTAVRTPAHLRITLANGVTLILIALPRVPLVAFEAVVRGGACLDPRERAGLASLSAELLTHGAGERSAFEFIDAVEGSGGAFGAEARGEALVLHGQFLARDLPLARALLADALQRPRLLASELRRLRERRIDGLRAAKDSEPQTLLHCYGRALLFGTHPYAHSVEGSERGLAAIQRADVMRYVRDQIGGDRLTLVFAGDFDATALAAQLRRDWRDWRGAGARLPVLPLPSTAARRVLLVDAPEATQTYFWLGGPGVARSFEPRAALDLANTALGGSFGSLLVQALRVRAGLTYSVSSSFRRGSVPGEFAISSFTPVDSSARALQETLSTLRDFKQAGLSAAALDSARAYVLGQHPLAFETAADWAGAFAELELYGLSPRYIDDYTAEVRRVDVRQTRAVIERAFPSAEELVMVLLGDAARIRGVAAQYGAVTELPLTAPDFAPRH